MAHRFKAWINWNLDKPVVRIPLPALKRPRPNSKSSVSWQFGLEKVWGVKQGLPAPKGGQIKRLDVHLSSGQKIRKREFGP